MFFKMDFLNIKREKGRTDSREISRNIEGNLAAIRTFDVRR